MRNPNLLFWEGHVDLGGPIVRDKVWFYGAYNHFKIDKVVSGVAEDVATDLGIFDNYTGKGTWKAEQNNTLIGYFQQGRKQKPQRGLSSLRPPESIQAQDSWSRMYKGEWQWVLANRAFLNVTVGNFTLDWPMVPAVDPAARPPQVFRDHHAPWRGAGWNSFTTGRKKPQVKAQLTYFLPEKGGSHDFKFGFENIYDSYRFGINGTNGPHPLLVSVRRRDLRAGSHPLRRHRVVGRLRHGLDGRRRTPTRTTPSTSQDRWTPNNRLSVHRGPARRLSEGRLRDGMRTPEIHRRRWPTARGSSRSVRR